MASIIVGETAYGKPNMASLSGELGRSIMQTIASTPKTDFSKLSADCEGIKARIREAKLNGTY